MMNPVMKKTFLGLLIPAVLLLAVLAASCSRQPRYPAPPQVGEAIVIDVAGLQIDTPQFYTLMVNGTAVSFFVVRHADKVVSFLDACVNCYRQKLGYGHKDGHVVCRACGTTYSIYKLDKGIGGCYPIRIEGKIEKGNYIIPASSLEKAAEKF